MYWSTSIRSNIETIRAKSTISSIKGYPVTKDINQAAAENGSIPLLQSPPSIKNDLLGSGITNPAFDSFIAVNFRLRAYDESSGPALLSRDSDLQAWIEFFRQAATKHPRLKFAILGKLEEKPEALLKLGNVFFPRLSGQSLGHELAWVECSRLFMGSSSGFAAMANFTKVPYFITRMNERAYANYDIPIGSEKLPFASEEQWLVDEEESPELLMELLERHLEGEGDGSCGEDTLSCDDSDNDLAARHLEQKAIFEEKAASLDSVADLFRQRRYPEVEKSLTPKLYKSLVSDEEKGKFHFMTGKPFIPKVNSWRQRIHFCKPFSWVSKDMRSKSLQRKSTQLCSCRTWIVSSLGTPMPSQVFLAWERSGPKLF